MKQTSIPKPPAHWWLGAALAVCFVAPVTRAGLIHDAARAGELGKVTALITADPRLIQSVDENGQTPLHCAAAVGALPVTRFLIEHKASITARDGAGRTPLHAVALAGTRDPADALLAAGAALDAKDSAGKTPLVLAAETGQADMLDFLFSKGATATVKQKTEWLRLALANKWGNAVQVLTTHGAEPDFFTVCALGNIEKATTLLRTQPGLAHAKDPTGATPLHYAASAGQFEIAKLLLNNGANPAARTTQKRTPLHAAAERSAVAIVRLLLANRASADVVDAAGTTPLLLAKAAEKQALAGAGNPEAAAVVAARETIEALTTAGAKADIFYFIAANNTNDAARLLDRDPNALTIRNKAGDLPLLAAIRALAGDMVQLLLARGADPNCRAKDGTTPLHLATGIGSAPLAESLLARGALIDARDVHGDTPLHWAVTHVQPQIIALLLAKKANATQRNKAGKTPADVVSGPAARPISHLLTAPELSPILAYPSPRLHQLAATNDVDQLSALFAVGRGTVNLEVRDAFGRTPLHLAVANGQREAVALLLNHGANVNAAGAMRCTPLHVAAAVGQPDIAIVLLSSGAQVNARDNRGLTPLGWAQNCQHPAVVTILRKGGGVP